MRRFRVGEWLCFWSWVVVVAPLSGQEATPTPEPRRGFWEARLAGGNYLVRLDAIRSISQHAYLVDGVGQVSEVNICTGGSALVRFYVVEAYTPQTPGGVGQSAVNLIQERGKQLAERLGGSAVNEMVLKNYPATTHARTIEFRLTSREDLDKLYESVERSWTRSRGEVFKP